MSFSSYNNQFGRPVSQRSTEKDEFVRLAGTSVLDEFPDIEDFEDLSPVTSFEVEYSESEPILDASLLTKDILNLAREEIKISDAPEDQHQWFVDTQNYLAKALICVAKQVCSSIFTSVHSTYQLPELEQLLIEFPALGTEIHHSAKVIEYVRLYGNQFSLSEKVKKLHEPRSTVLRLLRLAIQVLNCNSVYEISQFVTCFISPIGLNDNLYLQNMCAAINEHLLRRYRLDCLSLAPWRIESRCQFTFDDFSHSDVPVSSALLEKMNLFISSKPTSLQKLHELTPILMQLCGPRFPPPHLLLQASQFNSRLTSSTLLQLVNRLDSSSLSMLGVSRSTIALVTQSRPFYRQVQSTNTHFPRLYYLDLRFIRVKQHHIANPRLEYLTKSPNRHFVKNSDGSLLPWKVTYRDSHAPP